MNKDIKELMVRYEALCEVMESFKEGAAYIAIYTPVGAKDISTFMDTKGYIKEIKAETMLTLRNVRKQLIDALAKEHDAEIGVDSGDELAIEPFPIGTPKADYRG